MRYLHELGAALQPRRHHAGGATATCASTTDGVAAADDRQRAARHAACTSVRCRRGRWPPLVIEAIQTVVPAAPLLGPARRTPRPALGDDAVHRRPSSAWPMCPCAGGVDPARLRHAPSAHVGRGADRARRTSCSTRCGSGCAPSPPSGATRRPPSCATGPRPSPARSAASAWPTPCAPPATSSCASATVTLRSTDGVLVEVGASPAAWACPCRSPHRRCRHCPLRCPAPPPTRCSCSPARSTGPATGPAAVVLGRVEPPHLPGPPACTPLVPRSRRVRRARTRQPAAAAACSVDTAHQWRPAQRGATAVDRVGGHGEAVVQVAHPTGDHQRRRRR